MIVSPDRSALEWSEDDDPVSHPTMLVDVGPAAAAATATSLPGPPRIPSLAGPPRIVSGALSLDLSDDLWSEPRSLASSSRAPRVSRRPTVRVPSASDGLRGDRTSRAPTLRPPDLAA
jgi:hypothetical protein